MKSEKSAKSSLSTKLFNGKKIAERILLDLKNKIKKNKIKPKLAVISAGRNPASELFIRNKKRAAEKIGIKIIRYQFKENAREKEIIRKIRTLNFDRTTNGIIVQLPLPGKFNAEKIIEIISPQKDVDGFGKETLFSSPLISAILIALKKSTKNLKDRNILTLVNSDIFGRRLKGLLDERGIKIIYSKNRKDSRIKKADVLVSVLGRPESIRGDMIKNKAILIDAGISLVGKKKIIGDVDRKSVVQKAAFLTPVPGGIGPLTVALLLKNVYLAVKNQTKNN